MEQLSVMVSIATKRNLERISSHYGCTMTGMIEILINERTSIVLSCLSEIEKHEFYGEIPVHMRQNAR